MHAEQLCEKIKASENDQRVKETSVLNESEEENIIRIVSCPPLSFPQLPFSSHKPPSPGIPFDGVKLEKCFDTIRPYVPVGLHILLYNYV